MRIPTEQVCTFAKVGPNAVIQLGEAFAAEGLMDLAEQVYCKAGCVELLAHPPQTMIEESVVARLFQTVVTDMSPEMAADILSDAGKRTGEYILANRIPRFARIILPLLPKGLALRILLQAIGKHAWTFAGSGRFGFSCANAIRVEIVHNPIATKLGCIWHVGVFRVLFSRLLNDAVELREETCCGKGANSCSFRMSLATSPNSSIIAQNEHN